MTKKQQAAATKRVQLTRDSWVDAAIKLMVNESVESVKINRLTVDLQTTKGSFYWHFKSRSDLLKSILRAWTKNATIDVEARILEATPSPTDRLLLLLRLPLRSARALQAADLELAIVGWARRSPMVREAVKTVDENRTEYIAGLFLALGFKPEEAVFRAHVAYGFLRYMAQRRDLDVDARLKLTSSLHGYLTGSNLTEVAGVLRTVPVKVRRQIDSSSSRSIKESP